MLPKLLLLILLNAHLLLTSALAQPVAPGQENDSGRRAEVLFLGDTLAKHAAEKYAAWLAIKLFRSGINTTYTTNLGDLIPENLRKFDAIIIYSDYDTLPEQAENALTNFVEKGKGLILLHSAANVFHNAAWFEKTLEGQQDSASQARFISKVLKPSHLAMRGVKDFEIFDEVPVPKKLDKHNEILVTMLKADNEIPTVWVRNEGSGRVFSATYGHGDSTWTMPAFLDLVRNGVLWSLGENVLKQINLLAIPDVDIYGQDTLGDFSKRHLVKKLQPALTPAQSRKLIQIPPDFRLELFASEPDVVKPVAMTWDERGRLWVIESVDYPDKYSADNVASDTIANDRIKICEDTNGDGKADKFTIFADSLNIPTGLTLVNEGVIVAMSPYFVFLKDTTGDDRADVRKIMIKGWQKIDTHAGPSNLQYGFDNKIWGVTGFSGFSGTINGETTAFPQGVYRMAPNGEDFEFLAHTGNNTWGLGFTEDNNVFISTANDQHTSFYSMPGAGIQRSASMPNQAPVEAVQKIDGHYFSHTLTPNLRQVDVMGGFTSSAGHHFYTARQFPKEYWNRIALITEPTVRLIHKAIIEPFGAGFKENDGWNLAAASDEWFAPVHAEVGPDGAVWVADWYNFVIQHNGFETFQAPVEYVLPFREFIPSLGHAFASPLRDKTHGRIYRIVYAKAVSKAFPKLSKYDPAGLVSALANDNLFWRLTAQRLLVERGDTSVATALYALIKDQFVDSLGLNPPAIHALWTLHGLGMANENNPNTIRVIKDALRHPAASVRKTAASVLPKDARSFSALEKLLKDENSNVRLTVLVELAEYPASDIVGKSLFLVAQDSANLLDKWLSKALFVAAVRHQKGFIKAENESTSATDFSRDMAKAIQTERYPLGRRQRLMYPVDATTKEILLRTEVIQPADGTMNGVIFAHGDRRNGYSVYAKGGNIVLATRLEGKSYVTETKEKLPEKFELAVQITQKGEAGIYIDRKKHAGLRLPHSFQKFSGMPPRSGADGSTGIDDFYAGDFPFNGNFQNTFLELYQKPQKLFANESPTTEALGDAAAVSINLVVKKDWMQFETHEFSVKAGQKVSLNFSNPDGMPHNVVITKPGALETVGKAADELLSDPKASEKNYVPNVPEVIYASRLLNSGESIVLEFIAPETPGNYPFVCTFPGHWRSMNGIMKVRQ